MYMFEVRTMQIPCISCQARFRLDSSLIKITGSLVRCSKCKNIFRVYPPVFDNVQAAKDTNVDHSILDDISEVKQPNMANGLPDQTSGEINGYRIDQIASIGAFDEENEDPEIEDIDPAELSEFLPEYEEKVD